MNNLKTLSELFPKKIFRIPDYQRGYAWQKDQLEDFWRDLVNLSDSGTHYTGALTLKKISKEKINNDDNEYWLIDNDLYDIYHVIDGQQRLTTAIVFIQSFCEVVRGLDKDTAKNDEKILINDSKPLSDIVKKYLYKTKPGEIIRTYKFGYTKDDPSDEYLRYEILNEDGKGSPTETYYTLNLKNARKYFLAKLKDISEKEGLDKLNKIYKKLTTKFKFNEYIIDEDFDIFVAFEAMNNRGKPLSNLELLKNRLIYLTTLYSEDKLEPDESKDIREAINGAWKEIYKQLGRNAKHPLSDDEFLKAHWIMFFQYKRIKGDDYIKFLLNEKFSPRNVYKNNESAVDLELPVERHADFDDSDDAENTMEQLDDANENSEIFLEPSEIKKYVESLKESSTYWFNSFYPEDLSPCEKEVLEKLNRIGMGYFRPLVMSILKNVTDKNKKIEVLKAIERFIFIVLKLSRNQSNHKSSEYYNEARHLDRGEHSLEDIKKSLDSASSEYFGEGNVFVSKPFYDYLYKRFTSGKKEGYYGWPTLKYFLYEYELDLESKRGIAKKPNWDELLKTERDKLSIEHIFPQTPTDCWKKEFKGVSEEDFPNYSGSIGNLLLLSKAINSSLQNKPFAEKKKTRLKNEKELIPGYKNGSHSEIEVAESGYWTPDEIKKRGLKLLEFMEGHWNFKFKEGDKEKLLFLPDKANDELNSN